MPVGLADFPREVFRTPLSLAKHHFTDIVTANTLPRGGHFAALEVPDLLAQDLAGFVDAVLARSASAQ